MPEGIDFTKGFVLVKFGATWCGPCKSMEKTIEKVLPEFLAVRFFNIDIDDYPNLSKEYSIKSVPTVILFNNGVELNRISGSVKPEYLIRFLKESSKEKAA